MEVIDDTKDVLVEPKPSVTIWLSMFLLGVGVLLPWNVTVTSLDYFSLAFPLYHPAFVFPASINTLMALVQFFVAIYATHISFNNRIFPLFLICAALSFLLPFTVDFGGQTVSFVSCIIVLLLFGFFTGVLQVGVFG